MPPLKPRRHKLPVAPQSLLENCPPASPAAHRAMSSPVLRPPHPTALLCPPTAHSFCPEESWQSYSEVNKDTNGSSRQFCTCISMHYPFFFSLSLFCRHAQKTVIKPSLCVHDGLRCCTSLLQLSHGFRGSDGPEVSNEYTCVVCSEEDTGRSRARGGG